MNPKEASGIRHLDLQWIRCQVWPFLAVQKVIVPWSVIGIRCNLGDSSSCVSMWSWRQLPTSYKGHMPPSLSTQSLSRISFLYTQPAKDARIM
jgi:hypothetical protein